MTTVGESQQKRVLEKVVFPTLLKHTVDNDRTESSGRESGHSLQPSTVLVFVRSLRVPQVVLLFLQSSAKLTPVFIDLKNGEASFLASVGLRIKSTNGDLAPCNIVVCRILGNVFGTAPDDNHDKRVWADGDCPLNTGRDAHGTRWARVQRVEAAGVSTVKRFWHLVFRAEKVGIEDSLLDEMSTLKSHLCWLLLTTEQAESYSNPPLIRGIHNAENVWTLVLLVKTSKPESHLRLSLVVLSRLTHISTSPPPGALKTLVGRVNSETTTGSEKAPL